MATTKKDSRFNLTEKEMECVQTYIIDLKLQQKALNYAGINYAKFRSILDNGSGMTRRQYSRFMKFCKDSKDLRTHLTQALVKNGKGTSSKLWIKSSLVDNMINLFKKMEFEIKSESLETLENIKVVISKVTLRKVSYELIINRMIWSQ